MCVGARGRAAHRYAHARTSTHRGRWLRVRTLCLFLELRSKHLEQREEEGERRAGKLRVAIRGEELLGIESGADIDGEVDGIYHLQELYKAGPLV